MDMGSRSRCRRKTLTIQKSVFSLFFHRRPRFSCRQRQSGCSKASEIGPAAKLAATVSVDTCPFPLTRCCLALPPAGLPRRVPAHDKPSRTLLKDEEALQRTGSSQIAPVSGILY
jgi:hypothetical protein